MGADAQPHPEPVSRTRLGRGRSGIVYAETGPGGERLATKVFLPDRASTLVMTVLTGASNPYAWSAAAVETAVARRRVLEILVRYWFGDRLRLPVTHGSRWSEEHRAFELVAERIDGRHARLRHGLEGEAKNEVRELVHSILKPLQSHLAEAGFDGQLWQAGFGNPVAAANFMRERTGTGGHRWVWIDVESGVPALFPLNPWRLVRTYLPLCVKHDRWLFDDIDTKRLRAYLDAHTDELKRRLRSGGLGALGRQVGALEAHQRRWKSLRRHQRSISAQLAKGRIDQDTARAYWRRPVRWLGKLLGMQGPRGLRVLRRAGRWAARHLAPRPLLATLSRWGRFFVSQRVRTRWARIYVRQRVLAWKGRGFISQEGATRLRACLTRSSAAEYIGDFGIHLAIKPFMKLVVWGVIPALYATGVISSGWLTAALVVGGGAIGRTLYTSWRSLHAVTHGRPVPWVALAAGTLPVIGNGAYALQMLHATSRKDDLGARFLVRDILTGAGRRLPIWGGRDTLIEHGANAVATVVIRS